MRWKRVTATFHQCGTGIMNFRTAIFLIFFFFFFHFLPSVSFPHNGLRGVNVDESFLR